MDLAELKAFLTRYFTAQGDIASAALVGSRARGDARPDSDVDILVVFRPTAKHLAPVRRVELIGELSVLCHRRVDVVDLDRCSPVLAYHLLQHQVLLVDADSDVRLRSELRQISVYQDLSAARDSAVSEYLASRPS